MQPSTNANLLTNFNCPLSLYALFKCKESKDFMEICASGFNVVRLLPFLACWPPRLPLPARRSLATKDAKARFLSRFPSHFFTTNSKVIVLATTQLLVLGDIHTKSKICRSALSYLMHARTDIKGKIGGCKDVDIALSFYY